MLEVKHSNFIPYPRHCEKRSDEAIQNPGDELDCFAPLAMTAMGLYFGRLV